MDRYETPNHQYVHYLKEGERGWVVHPDIFPPIEERTSAHV